MNVYYIAFWEKSELSIEAFNNKDELNLFVNTLLSKGITKSKVVNLQNNASIKEFINLLADNKLSNAYHRMMKRNKLKG
ncbi:MAG: hypothetical protein AABZ14_02185 [Candidatus Margulisiibacteriota bacterium]